MHTLLIGIIRSANGPIVGVMALSAVVSILSILQPLLMQRVIDEGLMKADEYRFFFWLLIIILVGFGSIILSSLNRLAYTSVSMKILFSLREKVFAELFNHQKNFFVRHPSGDLLARIQGDVNEMQQFATDSVFALFSALIGLCGILLVIHNYSLPLTLAVLALLPFEFMILRPLYQPMEKSVRAMRENGSSLGQVILEMIRHIGLIQNYGASAMAVGKLNQLHQRQKALTLHNIKLQLVFTQLPGLVTLVGRGAILYYAGLSVIHHSMSLGELIAFLTYFGMILGPVQTLLGVLNAYPKAKVSFQRLESIMKETRVQSPLIEVDKGGLEIKSLIYRYPNTSYSVIDDLDLSVEYGETIAIFGRNGAGKSTLADIVCGLESPQSGRMMLNTHALSRKEQIRIAKLEQHPVILNDTLRLNLTLGTEHDDQHLFEVLNHVGLGEWVDSLENGLECVLAESGSALSGGERQRIALARLSLLKPAVAIFDEFTSSLDYMSTSHFYTLINELFPHSARIIITHDLEIITQIDRSYVLKGGKLHPMEFPHD